MWELGQARAGYPSTVAALPKVMNTMSEVAHVMQRCGNRNAGSPKHCPGEAMSEMALGVVTAALLSIILASREP